MHRWGDWPDEYFYDVGWAAVYIGDFCRRWGRIQVRDTKEKYGTSRVYCSFGIYSLYSIFHPGAVYLRWPKWFKWWEYNFFSPIIQHLQKWIPFYKWQIFIYRLAYKKAIKKWPHIKKEILAGADYDDLLEGLDER